MPIHDPVPEFDLYAELGVALDANTRTIDLAWRNRVRATHPDRASRGNDREATDQTARLNIARDWLTDPVRRARYDLLRRPLPRVELPGGDPLASWPVRRSATPSIGAIALLGLALIALIVLLATVGVGIGTNGLTIAAFALSLIFVVYFGLLGLLTAVVRSRGNG